jgi:thiamine monophosphate kinase
VDGKVLIKIRRDNEEIGDFYKNMKKSLKKREINFIGKNLNSGEEEEYSVKRVLKK